MDFMKRSRIWTPLLMVLAFALMLLPQVSYGADADKDIKELKEQIKKMEVAQAELYHSLEEKKSPGLLKEIAEKIAFGGLIELEASYDKNREDGDTSDAVLATVELALDADIHERVKASLLLLYEEDATDPINVDTGTVTVDMRYGLTFTGGKMYIPFGVFNSHFISDPLTLELAETNESALMLNYVEGPAEISFGVFNGETDDGGDDQIQDYFASVTVRAIEMLTVGAYYTSDIADSDGLTSLVSSTSIDQSVPGIGGFISAKYGPYMLDAEYIWAKREFEAVDLDSNGDGVGNKPKAYNIELAMEIDDKTEFAVRYEGSDDLPGFPERQYGVAVSRGIFDNVTGSIEYLTGKYESQNKRNLVTVQLGVEF